MTSTPNFQAIDLKFRKLQAALYNGSTRSRCLQLWSEFIRERDSHHCVSCDSPTCLSAHHICRKSFLANVQFDTGNGITLCSKCHKDPHRGFNRRPDLSLPVDAQNGEKLALMQRLFDILLDDAFQRDMPLHDYYHLSDDFLSFLKRMQGFGPEAHFPGSGIEQAYLILAECESSVRRAVLAANGFTMPDGPLLPGGVYVTTKNDDGTTDRQIFQSYRPRSI